MSAFGGKADIAPMHSDVADIAAFRPLLARRFEPLRCSVRASGDAESRFEIGRGAVPIAPETQWLLIQ